jgi:hypothetical protein
MPKPEIASSGSDQTASVSRIEERVFSRLEKEIARIAGIHGAQIASEDGAPTAIHVVADRSRPPKQLVRDVQSLAAAGFGVSVDHRIISVVQLDDAEPESPRRRGRAVLDRVIVGREAAGAWVRVGLSWPDGSSTDATVSAGASPDSRARAGAVAVGRAVAPVLARSDAALEVGGVVVQRLGVIDVVLAHGIYIEKGAELQLVGSAIVEEDAASAGVQAMLQAINRQFS